MELWENLPHEVVSALRVLSGITGEFLIPQELSLSRRSSLTGIQNVPEMPLSTSGQPSDDVKSQLTAKRHFEPLEMLSDRIASSIIGSVVAGGGSGNLEEESACASSGVGRRRSSSRPFFEAEEISPELAKMLVHNTRVGFLQAASVKMISALLISPGPIMRDGEINSNDGKNCSFEKAMREVQTDPKFELLMGDLVNWCDVSLPVLQSAPSRDLERAMSVLLGLKCCSQFFVTMKANSVRAGGLRDDGEQENGSNMNAGRQASGSFGQEIADGGGEGSGGACYIPTGHLSGDFRQCRFSEPMLMGEF